MLTEINGDYEFRVNFLRIKMEWLLRNIDGFYKKRATGFSKNATS